MGTPSPDWETSVSQLAREAANWRPKRFCAVRMTSTRNPCLSSSSARLRAITRCPPSTNGTSDVTTATRIGSAGGFSSAITFDEARPLEVSMPCVSLSRRRLTGGETLQRVEDSPGKITNDTQGADEDGENEGTVRIHPHTSEQGNIGEIGRPQSTHRDRQHSDQENEGDETEEINQRRAEGHRFRKQIGL